MCGYRTGRPQEGYRQPVAGEAIARLKDDTETQTILDLPPLGPWMNVQTTALPPHPNDPAAASD